MINSYLPRGTLVANSAEILMMREVRVTLFIATSSQSLIFVKAPTQLQVFTAIAE